MGYGRQCRGAQHVSLQRSETGRATVDRFEAGGGDEPSSAASEDHDLAEYPTAARFHAAFQRVTDPQLAGPEMVPARLARACAIVLEIDGAGISFIYDNFRFPLGASDQTSSTAEQFQFTQGEGPCLDAARTGQVLVAESTQIDRRWPSYAAELFARTPFRGVATIPISLAASTKGALDLFLIDERALASVRLADAVAVAEAVVEALDSFDAETPDAVDQATGQLVPSWLTGPSAQQRRYVWVALGMVMSRFRTSAPDALALLRSYAYGNGTDLDELALALVERRVTLDQLRISG